MIQVVFDLQLCVSKQCFGGVCVYLLMFALSGTCLVQFLSLCYAVRKTNQIKQNRSGFKKNWKRNNGLFALENSFHQTLNPCVCLHFDPG